jgi:hypothetical protein
LSEARARKQVYFYVESGSAKTVSIEDQPEYQPLKEFLEKIRSLAVIDAVSGNLILLGRSLTLRKARCCYLALTIGRLRA